MPHIDSFVCPVCGEVSWKPLEINEGYCSTCQDRTGVLGITGELIMARTAFHFQLTVEQLTCADRSRHVTGPRQIVMFLCRELTDMSLPRIGELLQRDHTTVMHGVRKVEGLMALSPRIHRNVAAIAGRVRGQASRYEHRQIRGGVHV